MHYSFAGAGRINYPKNVGLLLELFQEDLHELETGMKARGR